MTFLRRTVPGVLRSAQPFTRSAPRYLSVSSPLRKDNLSTNDKTKTDMLPDDEHSMNKAKKGDDYDVQTSNLKSGVE